MILYRYDIVKSILLKHKTLWPQRTFVASVVFAFIFLGASLFVNYNALKYIDRQKGSPTTDILLDNLPVFNTDIVFSEGALVFIIFITVLIFSRPESTPIVIKSLALFIFIRALFVSMTHIAPFPSRINTDLYKFQYFSSGSDLFFSGHVGIPALMAFLFWDDKKMRWIFIVCSIIAAVAVILGHLHYTIDVFSAYFISYGIWNISKKFFKKDFLLFQQRQG